MQRKKRWLDWKQEPIRLANWFKFSLQTAAAVLLKVLFAGTKVAAPVLLYEEAKVHSVCFCPSLWRLDCCYVVRLCAFALAANAKKRSFDA